MKRVTIAAVTTALVAVTGTLVLLYGYGTDGIIPFMLDTPAAIPQDVADANNAFAVEFYKQVAASEKYAGKNLFFSPAGMYLAFSALYEGARGDTAAQMEDMFGFDPDTQQRHDKVSTLLSSLNREDPHATFDMANAIWVAKQYPLYDSYTDTLQDTYLAHVESLDFAGDAKGNTDRINRWVSENTSGKIRDVITPDDVGDYAIVLNNSVRFDGMWFEHFTEDELDMSFWTGTDWVVDVFAYTKVQPFNYYRSAEAEVLQLPMRYDCDVTCKYFYEPEKIGARPLPDKENSLSMLVIQIHTYQDIKDLEELLSVDLIKKWQDNLQETRLTATIPKFEIKTSYNLNSILPARGMSDVFNGNTANLTGMADVSVLPGNIHVTEAAHDAYIKVGEGRTDVTGPTSSLLSRGGIEYGYFYAKNPFIFIIQDDESGTILFMGKVTDPTAE